MRLLVAIPLLQGCLLLAEAPPTAQQQLHPELVDGPPYAVAAGWHAWCALHETTDAATCEGIGGVTPPEGYRFTSIDGGGVGGFCGISGGGDAVCWGGDDVTHPGPFVGVGLGAFTGCAWTEAGDVTCWGDNSEGEADPPGGAFAMVAVGSSTACGVKVHDGDLACWGFDIHDLTRPPIGDFVDVALTMWVACAVETDGDIRCWGDEDDAAFDAPAGKAVSIDAGNGQFCALMADGHIACWGEDGYQQASPPGGEFVAVSAGDALSCGLSTESEVVCWGDLDF